MVAMTMSFDLRHPAQFAPSGAEIYRAALDMAAWADERGFAARSSSGRCCRSGERVARG